MESFWETLKNELVHHFNFETRQQAKQEISEYIGSPTQAEKVGGWRQLNRDHALGEILMKQLAIRF